MKKLFGYCSAVALMVVACAHNTQAQDSGITNKTVMSSNDVGYPQGQQQSQLKAGVHTFIDNFMEATNWNVHVETMHFDAFKNPWGVRAGFDYLVTEHVYTTLSACVANGTLYGMTGTVGIKGTWDVGNKGKLLISLAGVTGVGDTVSGMTFGTFTVPGKSEGSGQLFAIVGSHAVISFPTLKYMPNIIGGYERWSNLSGNNYSVGFHLPLHTITDLL